VHDNGDVDFNSELIKMDINVKKAEKLFEDAIKTLEGKEPKAKECEWCEWSEK